LETELDEDFPKLTRKLPVYEDDAAAGVDYDAQGGELGASFLTDAQRIDRMRVHSAHRLG